MTVPWTSKWRSVVGFDSYLISQYGQIFNVKRGQLVKPFYNNSGIKCVQLYKASSKRTSIKCKDRTCRSLRKLTENHWGEDSEYKT